MFGELMTDGPQYLAVTGGTKNPLAVVMGILFILLIGLIVAIVIFRKVRNSR